MTAKDTEGQPRGPILDVVAALRRIGDTADGLSMDLASSIDRAVTDVAGHVGAAPALDDRQSIVSAIRGIGAAMVEEVRQTIARGSRLIHAKAQALDRLVAAWDRILDVVSAPGTTSAAVPPPVDVTLPHLVEQALVDPAAPAPPPTGHILAGFFNTNIVVHTSAGVVVVRTAHTPDPGEAPFKACRPSPWDEADVLRHIGPLLPFVPQLIHSAGDAQIHRWIAGRQLAPTDPYPPELPVAVATRLARVATVPADALPPLPTDWPADGDTVGYATMLLDPIEAFWADHVESHGALYEALGFPDAPFARLRDQVSQLTSRSFGLLHGDLHAGNLLLTPEPVFLDWEFASFGDPVTDMAFILEKRPYYDIADQAIMVRVWADHLGEERSRGFLDDLPVLRRIIAIRQAVMTPVLSLGAEPSATTDLLSRREYLVARFVNRVNDLWDVSEPLSMSYVAEQLRRFAHLRAQ